MKFDIIPSKEENFLDLDKGYHPVRIIIPSRIQLSNILNDLEGEISSNLNVLGIICSNVSEVRTYAPKFAEPHWTYVQEIMQEHFGKDSFALGAIRNWNSYRSLLIPSRLEYKEGTGDFRYDFMINSLKK